jgi:hypothetical protein
VQGSEERASLLLDRGALFTQPFRRKEIIMNTHISTQEQDEMTVHTDTMVTDLERLAADGFPSEEIVSLLWLRQWYQTGGSDRVAVLRHWEFLKLLVLTGKLDV